MQKKLYQLALAAAVVATSCGRKAQEAKTEDAKPVTQTAASADSLNSRYVIENDRSELGWRGSEKTMSGHDGTLKIKEGVITVENRAVTGGSFVIDMTSLASTDLSGDKKAKLEGHLKNQDFFDVAKYPEARFDVTEVVPYAPDRNELVVTDTTFLGPNKPTHMITGNLRLKDSTKSIAFPAYIEVNGDDFHARAKFAIDRTKWGIHYRSAESFGNEMINKELELKLRLFAHRQRNQ